MTRSIARPAHRFRTPLAIHVAAWSVPVLVLGQFAMVAVLPIAALIISSFTATRARALRVPSAVLGLVYAVPVAIWALRPDGAPSLSKDMHPAFSALITLAAAGVLLAIHLPRRR